MNLVLCMAGLYRRFREQGYDAPKYLLRWRGAPILEHVLRSALADVGVDNVLLVANRRDAGHAGEVRAILARHGIEAGRLIYIGDTRGQAETAAIGAQTLADEGARGPVLFHNIDTVLGGRDGRAIAQALDDLDGWIDVFRSDSPKFSYVALGENGLVERIAEKQVISPFATSGLYGFASAEAYLAAAEGAALGGGENAEFYISHVYAAMLAAGARIGVNRPRPSETTTVLGTPEEYRAALKDGA